MEDPASSSSEKLQQSMAALEDSTSDDSDIDSTSGCHENEDILCDLCSGRKDGGLCSCPNTVGRCSCPPNSASSPSCMFYSPRIVSLVEGQRTEFETAQDHWTVVDVGSVAELERVGKENCKYFDEVLVKHPEWGKFFGRYGDLVVGAKIGEGGQAEIFAASSNNITDVVVLLAHDLEDLLKMHEVGIVHRDIKASNVLKFNIYNPRANSRSVIIDYECSVGVTGTGFWRVPEILEQLQKRVPGDKVVFTEKADIYSFGMLCYEMITGCIPFEGHPWNDYSVVLLGKRPELPDDLDPRLKGLVECWQHDPKLRPTSSEIYGRLRSLGIDLGVDADVDL